jgi:HEAT repeat protein
MTWPAAALFAILLQDDPTRVAERLASDDIRIREEAEETLVKLGAAARAVLLPLRESGDPETAFRARRVIGHIDWDPTLPPCFRRSPHIPFAGLGSADSREFEKSFVAMSRIAGGISAMHRARDLDRDATRKRILFVRAGVVDEGMLQEWVRTLDPEALWNEEEEFARTLVSHLESRSWKGERFDTLKPLLKSPARSRRALAAMVLAQEGDADALPILVEFIGDKERLLENRVCFYLRRSRYLPAKPKILEFAAKGDLQAFSAMTEFGWDGHLDDLRKIALDFNGAHLPWMAHEELAKRGDPSALPRLLDVVRAGKGVSYDTSPVNAALAYDTDEAIEAGLSALDQTEYWGAHRVDRFVQFGPRGARKVWDRFVEEKKNPKPPDGRKLGADAYLQLFCRKKDLVEPARKALHGEVPEPVLTAAIGILGDPWSRAVLDAKDLNRLRAVAALETKPDAPATVLLRARLDSIFIAGQIALGEEKGSPALAILQGLDTPEVRAFFMRLAGSGDRDSRRFAAQELGRFRDPERAALLVGMFRDDSDEVRAAVARSLSHFPDRLLRNHLASFENIPEAKSLVLRMSPPQESPAEKVDGVDALRRALDPVARKSAYGELGRMGTAQAVDILVEAAWTEHEWEAGRAVFEALSLLDREKTRSFIQECAAASDRGIRVPALWATLAARHGHAEAVPALRRAVDRSPDPTALRALDLLVHREEYAQLPGARYRSTVENDLLSAFEEIAGAHGIGCVVSPQLVAEYRKEMRPESSEGEQSTKTVEAVASLRPRLSETLADYEPSVRHTSYYRSGISCLQSPFPWAPWLEKGVLRILTPEEAGARWRKQ